MYYMRRLKMLYFLWIFCYFKLKSVQAYATPKNQLLEFLLKDKDLTVATNILNTTEDIVADSAERISSLFIIKQDNMRYASFEIGYIVCIIQNKYKKMVDKYESVNNITTFLYKPEILIILEEVESLYWEITHLANMLHEVERKFKLYGSMDEDYSETLKRKLEGGHSNWGVYTGPPESAYFPQNKKKKKKKGKMNIADYISERLLNLKKTEPRKRPAHFPIDYGWYVEPEERSEG